MKQARADRYRREHAVNMARLGQAAGRPLAPRGTRIRLAVGYLATIAVMVAVGITIDGPWGLLPFLGSLAIVVALWFALRRATSLVTEAPDEVLDELQIRLRNAYYRDAYPMLSVAAMTTVFLLPIVSRHPDASASVGNVLLLALAALASGLPMIVTAFRMPDVDAGE